MVWGTWRDGTWAGIYYLLADHVVLVPLHAPVRDGRVHGGVTSWNTITWLLTTSLLIVVHNCVGIYRNVVHHLVWYGDFSIWNAKQLVYRHNLTPASDSYKDSNLNLIWHCLVFGYIERTLTKPRLCDYRSIIACYLHMQPWVASFPLPDFQ